MICDKIHGESGLDGFKFPPHNKTYDKRDSSTFIHDLVINNKDVVLVPTGPLTNIAKYINEYPDDLVSSERRELLIRYLCAKKKLLLSLLKERKWEK